MTGLFSRETYRRLNVICMMTTAGSTCAASRRLDLDGLIADSRTLDSASHASRLSFLSNRLPLSDAVCPLSTVCVRKSVRRTSHRLRRSLPEVVSTVCFNRDSPYESVGLRFISNPFAFVSSLKSKIKKAR
jgi:hypothetical protein